MALLADLMLYLAPCVYGDLFLFSEALKRVKNHGLHFVCVLVKLLIIM